MSGNAQWPFGIDATGNYVHILGAIKGIEYSCPECGGRFVARQGKQVKWHFAHFRSAGCSTGEGGRHSLAKHIVARRLLEPLKLGLRCQHHMPTKNYCLVASDVELEEIVGEFRTDVAFSLKFKTKTLRIYVEIVDHHATTIEKEQFLNDRFFDVIISDIPDGRVFEIATVEERFLKALSEYVPKLAPWPHGFIHIWTQTCFKCSNPTPVAIPCHENTEEAARRAPGIWAKSLPQNLLNALRQHVRIERRPTNEVKDGYYANVCQSCQTTQGDFYLRSSFVNVLEEDEEAVTTQFWFG